MSDEPVPVVTCTGCGRRCSCLRMKDGKVYRPFAWKFPDAAEPLAGLCHECKTRLVAFDAKRSCWVEVTGKGEILRIDDLDAFPCTPRDGEFHLVER